MTKYHNERAVVTAYKALELVQALTQLNEEQASFVVGWLEGHAEVNRHCESPLYTKLIQDMARAARRVAGEL